MRFFFSRGSVPHQERQGIPSEWLQPRKTFGWLVCSYRERATKLILEARHGHGGKWFTGPKGMGTQRFKTQRLQKGNFTRKK